MSDFKDKEPEIPSYLNKDFDDSTKRIEVVKETTQKVETVKDDLKTINNTNGETQVIDTVKDEILKVNTVSGETIKVDTINTDIKSSEKENNQNQVVESSENTEVKKKAKKEKKELTLKKIILRRIIFLVLFAIIAICLTFFFASKNNPEVKDKIEEITNTIINPTEEPKEEVAEKTVDINGTYYINPIEITKYEMDVLGKKVEYVQIDGLKDEAIENKINTNIREKINAVATELLSKYVVTDCYSSCAVMGNFANVLSISAYVQVSINDWDETHGETISLNYNLLDGNNITINDVFSSKLKLENVFVDELYESVVLEYSEFDENYGDLIVPEDVEDIEEIVYSIISDYQRGKDISFYITPQKVAVKAGIWSEADIYFCDYLDYVIIYDKYMSKTDIFDGKYEVKKAMPNLSNLYQWRNVEEYVDKEGSNYYINAVLFSSSYEYIPESVLNSVTTIFNDYVKEKEVTDSANRKDGMFRLYNIKFDLSYWDGVYYLYIDDVMHDTTKSKYTSVLKDAIKKFFMEEHNDMGYMVGNLYLSELNYYEPIMVNGEQEYEFHEVIPYEEIHHNYATAKFDSIGNMFSMDGEETILEIID